VTWCFRFTYPFFCNLICPKPPPLLSRSPGNSIVRSWLPGRNSGVVTARSSSTHRLPGRIVLTAPQQTN
jgi:hypothetical protein